MTGAELKGQFDALGLNAAEAAKVLCLHTGKVSEYLSDVGRIPCSLTFTLELLQRLPESERTAVIAARLQRSAHSG